MMDGKKVFLFYNDTANTVSKIVGEIIVEKTDFIEIDTEKGLIRVPISKIVRIERQGGGRYD